MSSDSNNESEDELKNACLCPPHDFKSKKGKVASFILPPFKGKIAEIKKGSRGVGSGQDTAWVVKDVRLRVTCSTSVKEGEVTAPREGQSGREGHLLSWCN